MGKSKVENRKLVSNRMLCKTQSHDWEHCSGNNNFIAFWDDINERVNLKCPYWTMGQDDITYVHTPAPKPYPPFEIKVKNKNSTKEVNQQLEFKL